jgi:hypothetical protein
LRLVWPTDEFVKFFLVGVKRKLSTVGSHEIKLKAKRRPPARVASHSGT